MVGSSCCETYIRSIQQKGAYSTSGGAGIFWHARALRQNFWKKVKRKEIQVMFYEVVVGLVGECVSLWR
jgi:hypothetical protein